MPIDIMMPFYGSVDQLKIAVESVRAQTGHWRLVVIDDRYPGTEQAEYFAGLDDPRVEYVVNDVNLGISGNFQRSIDLARAEHVVIMGCDDVMLPGYVEHLDGLIERYPDADYYQPGVATIDASGNRSRPLADRVKAAYRPRGRMPQLLIGQQLAVSLLRGNWTYFPSLCWKASALRQHGFRKDYEIVLDLALQLEIAEREGVLVVDDTIVFEYRRHRASASAWNGSDDRRFAEERAFFIETAARLRAQGWTVAARTARAHLSSRLNAASQLPGALLRGDSRGVGALAAHVAGRRTP